MTEQPEPAEPAEPADLAPATPVPIIDEDRLSRGAAVFEEVYGGVIPAPPPGLLDFADVMLGQLFAEQWARPQLARRDRRLLTLATIAAVGDADTWAIHLEAAVRNGELTPVEARETVIHLAAYVGYPRASPLLLKTEEILGRIERDTAPEPAPDTP